MRPSRLWPLALLLLVAPAVVTAAPPNDACVDATVVAAATELEETVDTTTAATDVDDPLQSCTTGGPSQNAHSIWYTFTAPVAGILSVYTLDTDLPADPPTIVSVHTGGCGTLGEVACYDSETPIASYLHTAVTSGTTYWILITSEVGSLGGPVDVRMYFDPDSPICPDHGGNFLKSSLSLVGLGGDPGDERLKMAARMVLHQPMPNAVATGFQLLAEDYGSAYTPIVEWSERTLAVPPGAPGTGCYPKDGWTASSTGSSYRYRNTSNAFPPVCVAGSANGLTEVRLHRKSGDNRIVDVKVRATGTTLLAMPVPDPFEQPPRLRLSATLESTIGPTNADRCAHSFIPLDCKFNGSGSTLSCKGS